MESTAVDIDLEQAFKALASARRLQILEWLRDPVTNFPTQEHGDPIEHGACNQFIVEKLGVSQPAGSRHLKVLADADLIIATPRKGWTYYRRNEPMIAAVAQRLAEL
ncbi:MAG: winged helix-turn-helix transcriptional regulator [Acidimicrobiales bacterium]|nr:winged helix-turn-helix transcriptional regulator [Acidimicrobiales bacterium]